MFQFDNENLSEHVRAEQREQKEAQRIARTIAHENNLSDFIKSVSPRESGWDIAGHKVWNDPGTDMVMIPKFQVEAYGELYD